MNTLVFVGLDLRRMLTDLPTIFFSITLPVIFFLIFGAAMAYGPQPLGNTGANMSAYVMVGMALFAGVTGAVAAAGTVVLEHQSGWGRQLALTPLTQAQLLVSNLVGIGIRAVLPVLAVYVTGALTTAEMAADDWLWTFLLTAAMATPFGFYGLAWSLIMPTSASVSLASTSIVVLGFLGNMFTPLPENLLDIGRLTPVYGAVTLARYPIADGSQVTTSDPILVSDPLWYALLNVATWTIVFILVCVMLRTRDKGRR